MDRYWLAQLIESRSHDDLIGWFDIPTASKEQPTVFPMHEMAPLTKFVGLDAMNCFRLGLFIFFTASKTPGPTFGVAISIQSDLVM